MKTTIDIPDELYPRLAAMVSAKGQTIESYLLSNVRKDLAESPREKDDSPATEPRTLKERFEGVFGSVDSEVVAEVQAVIDEEFSKIDPEDWE